MWPFLKQQLSLHLQPPEEETIPSVPPATQVMPVEVQEEEMTVHIVRGPNQGLGISIAGGKGSPPVKGDDDVGCFCY